MSLECFISNCVATKIKNCIIQVANTSSWSEVDRVSTVSSVFVVVVFLLCLFPPNFDFPEVLISLQMSRKSELKYLIVWSQTSHYLLSVLFCKHSNKSIHVRHLHCLQKIHVITQWNLFLFLIS